MYQVRLPLVEDLVAVRFGCVVALSLRYFFEQDWALGAEGGTDSQAL